MSGKQQNSALISLIKNTLGRKHPIITLILVALLGGGGYVATTQLGSENASTPKTEIVAPTTASQEDVSDFLKLTWDGNENKYYTEINNNKSTFTASDLKENSGENYWVTFSKRDKLGRAGQANARLDRTHYLDLKKQKRPSIPDGNDPVGWYYDGHSNNKQIYFNGEATSVYNRSHLIAYMFTGDPGSMENLVTGTRAMNDPGMNEWEQDISDALYWDKVHIRYQVTPIYKGNELVPRGVHMMAKSIEDNGKAYDLNIYVFNIQPGWKINYTTGQTTKE
jgi:DNA-entry nuclease